MLAPGFASRFKTLLTATGHSERREESCPYINYEPAAALRMTAKTSFTISCLGSVGFGMPKLLANKFFYEVCAIIPPRELGKTSSGLNLG